MSIGELLVRQSDLRLHYLRRPPETPGRFLKHLLHWGAWLNYLLSVVVLTAGITAGWRFAEIGFDLMMNNVSGQEVQQQIIKKIPAWMLVQGSQALVTAQAATCDRRGQASGGQT